ncbi:retrotransposon protein, putative, ty1-copia subclass [Tanacetum coccineum]
MMPATTAKRWAFNTRAKYNLDSTYLWHCRLAHISKKRIEKLQHDGLLKSTDEESFDQCVSCSSGKMTRKLFLHRTERATDLLGLIHTDVYGLYRHDYALESATRILNMVPTKKVDKTPGRVVELKEIQDEDTSPSENISEIPMEVEGFEPPQEEVIPVRRSARTHEAPKRLCLNVEVEEHSFGDLNEPTNYKAALLNPESDKWVDAMNAEMQFMKDNQEKTDMDGIVRTYKACRVAKGFTQTYEVDYKETFSPVADTRAIRILIAIAAFYDYEIWQMDVKIAFLNGYLDEDIYMVQPEGFVDLISSTLLPPTQLLKSRMLAIPSFPKAFYG